MTPEQLLADFAAGFAARRFSAGLLIAFVDFFGELGTPSLRLADFDAFLARFPRQVVTNAGKRANTLIVARGETTLSLRPFYNAAERFFRAEHKRFDYPSCAPHATQAWADYRGWLDALAGYDAAQLAQIRKAVADFVLATLKNQAFDPASVKVDPPLFQMLLEEFELTAQPGEPTGAAFQGMVFGFLRADNPHLQIEIDKVRTGSKRLQRVGDIDAWEGSRLAISAEVKQFDLKADDVPDLEAFANATAQRGAIGIIAALGFKDGVRELLIGMGLRAVDREDMLRIVELWDPLKQRTAAASLAYYARHVEKNSSLGERVESFLLGRAT
ncbi:MAG: hypothetical protein SXG53_04720 [Pseudomonadota bacterium]|nr:hypothetical protein [Pseudomonadota bacterium]